mgnify:CR=1 FL=1|tara:strand:- start:951 stop:1760 length:810 start_codon:yes stop_codon:yes gene_type:complete
MEFVISISQISILTGHNIYQSQRDYLINFWKKTNKDDFLKYKEITNFEVKDDKIVFNNIAKKHKLDIHSDLYKCYKSQNTGDLDKNRNALLKKVENLNEKDKKEITDSIKNLSNTRFGVKNEDDVCKIYENMMKCEITKDNLFIKKKIIENNNFTIKVGGKIDGINKKDGSIIEIKNRMKKLFYELRGYEKIQLMCYLYLFQSEKGYLVEAYKKKDGTDINIIECQYDEDLMNKIINVLNNFGNYYFQFLNNHDLKIELLTNENFELNF